MQFLFGLLVLFVVLWIGHTVDKKLQARSGLQSDKYGRIADSPRFMTFFWIVIGLMVVWYSINAVQTGTADDIEGCYGSMRC